MYCSGCKTEKPITEFSKNKRMKSGYANWCKICIKKNAEGSCANCGCRIADKYRSVLCTGCKGAHQLGENNSRWKGGRSVYKGYVFLAGYKDHPNCGKSGKIAEHVLVMSEMLNRPLVAGENVHHKNGNRSDNRPNNLELWVSRQPVGQRPEDLVTYAREILALYEKDFG